MHAFPVDLYPHLARADANSIDALADLYPRLALAEGSPPPLPPLPPPRRATRPALVTERRARVAAWLGVAGTQDSGEAH
jgi:hypothetical protein